MGQCCVGRAERGLGKGARAQPSITVNKHQPYCICSYNNTVDKAFFVLLKDGWVDG